LGVKWIGEWVKKNESKKINLHNPRKKSITPPIVKIRTERYAAAA
jgi:hypothetical protein